MADDSLAPLLDLCYDFVAVLIVRGSHVVNSDEEVFLGVFQNSDVAAGLGQEFGDFIVLVRFDLSGNGFQIKDDLVRRFEVKV